MTICHLMLTQEMFFINLCSESYQYSILGMINIICIFPCYFCTYIYFCILQYQLHQILEFYYDLVSTSIQSVTITIHIGKHLHVYGQYTTQSFLVATEARSQSLTTNFLDIHNIANQHLRLASLFRVSMRFNSKWWAKYLQNRMLYTMEYSFYI